MSKTLLFIGDPIETLNFSSDSSLALAQGALELGFRVFWATPEHISLLNGTPIVSSKKEIKEVSLTLPPTFHSLHKDEVSLNSFDKILIRKDPPFDEAYTDLCWILSQCEPRRVINKPESLLTFHEKLTPWYLAAEGLVPHHMMVPTIISQDTDQLISFAQQQFSQSQNFLEELSSSPVYQNFKFQLIGKPWRGHGGRGIQIFQSIPSLQEWISKQHRSIKSSDKACLSTPWILQPFLPQIHSQGDRRVFVVNGKIAFHFVRIPAPGRVEANLAQGGSAKLEMIPAEVSNVSQEIAQFLKRNDILIAGIDFIGDYLTEVNITSPTGIRTFEGLTSSQITTQILSDLLRE